MVGHWGVMGCVGIGNRKSTHLFALPLAALAITVTLLLECREPTDVVL
jgi:hypothetical protein